MTPMASVSLWDLNISYGTPQDFVTLFNSEQKKAGFSYWVTLNPEMVICSDKDPLFRALLMKASCIVPDGMGISLAVWRHLKRKVQRMPGVTLATTLCNQDGINVFCLGGTPHVSAMLVDKFNCLFPTANLVGAHHGYAEDARMGDVWKKIRVAEPDLVLVGMGSPKQEKWLSIAGENLSCGVGIGVGGTFDVWTGMVSRSPVWMQKLGLEWVYRFVCQPTRWRRLGALVKFCFSHILTLNR